MTGLLRNRIRARHRTLRAGCVLAGAVTLSSAGCATMDVSTQRVAVARWRSGGCSVASRAGGRVPRSRSRTSCGPTSSVRHGLALAGVLAALNASAALGQSPPSDSIELALGVDRWGSARAPFVSAGLYLDDSLAVFAEATGPRHASGELAGGGQAPPAFVDSARSWPSKPAACPRVEALLDTLMGGVQYRRPIPNATPFAQVLGGRAGFSAIASEPGTGGVETSCYEAFGSGRAMAVAGGVDVRLGRRARLRFIVDYRRLAIPGLEGLEAVLAERASGRHLKLARVGVAFVIGI